MTNNMLDGGGNIKAAAPVFTTVIHGPAGRIPVHEMTADELSDLQSAGWPVRISDTDYSATVLTPYAIGGGHEGHDPHQSQPDGARHYANRAWTNDATRTRGTAQGGRQGARSNCSRDRARNSERKAPPLGIAAGSVARAFVCVPSNKHEANMSNTRFKRKQIVKTFGMWLRLYVDVYDNPKVQSLPASLFRSWVNILCIAKKFGGKSGRLPLENLAFYLRCEPRDVDPIIGELIRAGLVEYADDSGDRILRPKDWTERQMVDWSLSTERVKKHRQRLKKAVTHHETFHVTFQETQMKR